MHYISTEEKEGFAIITLNYAINLNAITTPLLKEIVQALQQYSEDSTISCVILAGSEDFFSAGIDIEERKNQDFVKLLTDDHRFSLWKKIADFDKPMIAAVSGYAVGPGLELASMCDIIIASNSARFAMPEVTIASLPESGCIKRLIFLAGKAKAMEMLLTGRNMDAMEAEKIGMVSRIVPAEYLLKDAIDVASRISKQPPVTVKMIKKASRNAFDMNLSESMEAERMLFKAALSTEDAKEGISAFLEKRTPVFKGK